MLYGSFLGFYVDSDHLEAASFEKHFVGMSLCKEEDRRIKRRMQDGIISLDEKGKEVFATNPLGLTIVRGVGPDSLLVKWLPIADPKITCYEIYSNGLLMQRVMSPGRNKALLHPVDLAKKMIITLNALSYDGEKEESATVSYRK